MLIEPSFLLNTPNYFTPQQGALCARTEFPIKYVPKHTDNLREWRKTITGMI
jgi:hypothetical protein